MVSIRGDASFLNSDRKHHFSEFERAAGVASLQTVDQVVLLGERNLYELIQVLKPDVLVLGKEFEYELDDLDDRYLATGTEDLVLDVACFDKTSEACQDVDNSLVQVVFIVDMQQEIVSENGVGLLGTNPEFTNFGFDVETGLPNDPYDENTWGIWTSKIKEIMKGL